MRIIEPAQFHYQKAKKQPKSYGWVVKILAVFLVALIVASAWSYSLPLPRPQVHAFSLSTTPQVVSLSWPKKGQAAVASPGYGVLDDFNSTNPVPMASIAKIMVALAVLRQKPLDPGQQGPAIVMTVKDEALYDSYVEVNGSVLPVSAGEQISQYQALQALLLASANNIADTLVNWQFGSLQGYTAYANNRAKTLGLKHTYFADASGFSPKTTSTAHDLAILGLEAMKNPVIAQIVAQKSATISIVGPIENRNLLLGQQGINGIKTGNTDQAGGCYLFAASKKIGAYKVEIVGVVLGADSLDRAMQDSLKLLSSTYNGFGSQTVVADGQKVGYYEVPWRSKLPIEAQSEAKLFGWLGKSLQADLNLKDIDVPAAAGTQVGSIKTGNTKIPVQITEGLARPSLRWRLLRWL